MQQIKSTMKKLANIYNWSNNNIIEVVCNFIDMQEQQVKKDFIEYVNNNMINTYINVENDDEESLIGSD